MSTHTLGPWYATDNGRECIFISDAHGDAITVVEACNKYNALVRLASRHFSTEQISRATIAKAEGRDK